MPHITVDYTANVQSLLDLSALAEELRALANNCGHFPVGGIRVVCHRGEPFAVANGDRDNAFVTITIRILPGRSDALKHQIAELFFGRMKERFAHLQTTGKFGFQLELVEFTSGLNFQDNSLLATSR